MTARLTLISVALTALALAAPAQSVYDLALSGATLESLPEQARVEYDLALEAINHADHPGALTHLTNAANLAPDMAELQLTLLSLHCGGISPSESLNLGEKVEACRVLVERVLTNPDATAFERRRAERAHLELEQEISEAVENREALEDVRGEILQHAAQAGRLSVPVPRARQAEDGTDYTARGGLNTSDSVDGNPLLRSSDEVRRGRDSARTSSESVGANRNLPQNVGL